ncbi:hypothetical protein F5876DRAFT_71029 [Lentinula aff. lateritia]|uniref:Uncharacterized protein n=1 Tax=Lentinula aff. lateritia TaxID=2804960 RepID=A0ACC1THN9_9AGAR|nr:hypothetical protein F5876DRAFT_71029 [Lentinula aff. lateritia]
MSSPSKNTHRSSLPSPTAASNLPVPHEEGGFPPTEDEEDVDQLAFTLDSPSHPQLEFFEKVFNTGKPLAGYSSNDPLWCHILVSYLLEPPDVRTGKSFNFGTPLGSATKTLHIVIDSWNYMALLLKKLPGPSWWTSGVGTIRSCPSSLIPKDKRPLQLQNRNTSRLLSGPGELPPLRLLPRPPTSVIDTYPLPPHYRPLFLDWCAWSFLLVGLLLPSSLLPTPLPFLCPPMLQLWLWIWAHLQTLEFRDFLSWRITLVWCRVLLVWFIWQQLQSNELVQIEGTSQDLLSSNMPPCCSRLIPRSHTTYPYCVENEQLSPFARYLPLIGSSATGGGAIADLPVGGYTAGVGVLLSLGTVPRSGEGSPRASRAVERLHKVQEELLSAREEKEVAKGCHSSSACQNSELQASIVHQGLVDENNALAARQCQRIETLQEEVH